MQEPTSSRLSSLLSSLQIPSEYSKRETYEPKSDANILTRLQSWKKGVTGVLYELQELLNQISLGDLSLAEQANVIAATAAFDGDDDWTTSKTREKAAEILKGFSEPEVPFPLMKHLLFEIVKPLFRSNPHPSLNLNTGRKLARQAGGPMASQDFYESQTWKDNPGAPNLVFWCLKHIKSEDYVHLWFLVVPPVMILLDDYQVPYKLKGVQMVSVLLQRVPKEILKRTGVDGLILTSLNTCLAQLDHPETPSLVRAAISASLSLTLLTTTPGSEERFNQLCALLGERIIGTIWLYSSAKPDVILASTDALPELVKALGLGCTRYLKALVPQLVHPLLPVPLRSVPPELQISSLRVLNIVIKECAPRMTQWKGTIMNGVARCWVTTVESPPDEISCRDELQAQLRKVCQALANACRTVTENEFRVLRDADHVIFASLFE